MVIYDETQANARYSASNPIYEHYDIWPIIGVGGSKGVPHFLFLLFVLASYTFRIDRMMVNDAPFLWVGGFTAFIMIILLADMVFFSGLIFELHENVGRAVFIFICSGIMAKCLWALKVGDGNSL